MAEDTAQSANWAAQLRANQISEAKRREDLRLTQERRAAAAKGAQGKAQAFSWKQSPGIGLMDTRASAPLPTPPPTAGQPSGPVANEQLVRQQLLARQSVAQAQAMQQQAVVQSQVQSQAQGAVVAQVDQTKKKKEADDMMMADLSSAFQLGDKGAEASLADGGTISGPTDLIIFTLRFLKSFVLESFAGIHPLLDKFFPKYRMGLQKPMDMANLWISGGSIALVFSIMLFIGLAVGMIGWIISSPVQATQLLGPAIVASISGAPAVITN